MKNITKSKKAPTDAELLQSRILEIETRIKKGLIPMNPTRIFDVGDSVRIGNLQGITVTHVIQGGLGYVVHYDYMGESYGRPKQMLGDGSWAWIDVFPIDSRKEYLPHTEPEDVRINFYNNDIDSLLHKVYSGGVDFNPDYQRDLVWDHSQKIALIDSIFARVDIGKFTFIQRPYSDMSPLHYEILDGKQRLTTICEFYEDRFEWRGLRFSQLCNADNYHFSTFPIIQGEISNATRAQILRLFVRLNTAGAPMDLAHLSKVQSMIPNQ